MNNDTYTPCTKCGRPLSYCKGQCCGKAKGCDCQEYGPKVCGAIRPGEPKCPYQAVIPSLTVESVGNLKDLADCFVHVSDINTTFYIDDKHRIMTTWAGLVSVEDYDFDANPLNLRDQIAYDAKNNTAAIYNKQGANYIFQISDINNDYMLLEDKPQINGVTLEGNKSAADLGVPDIDEVAMVFDTVADMAASTNLTAGSYAQTLGYHAVDDNGAAFFVIKNTGTADGKSVIALDGGLYAHMVYKHDFVTPEQFGAYGDGTHDDSDAIQAALDSGKVVEFSPKIYMCLKLEADYPTRKLVIHGNGATLKRPDLTQDPYNYTVDEMKQTRTLEVNSDADIQDLTFDNNCFTMWSLSDGYAQEQSASLFITNPDTKFYVNISNCKFQYSAGDGILVYNNAILNINNCESYETFRGGLTMVGTSEINVDGWISTSVTLPDGLDVEMASGAVAGKFILNMNNIVVDWDFDIVIPANGEAHISNVVMREFDQNVERGMLLGCYGNGILSIENSTLRSGVYGNHGLVLSSNGMISFDNCKLIGNTTSEIIDTLIINPAENQLLRFNNCIIRCYDFLSFSLFNGYIDINNCDIECSHSMIVQRGNAGPQPKSLSIKNSRIKASDTFVFAHKTNYVTWAEGVNVYLSNLQLEGTGVFKFSGFPNIHYNNLVMEAGYTTTLGGGAVPVYIGNERLIVVPSATDLTFKGWKENNDLALALDTGAYYRYTTGTTWTVI